MVWGKVPENVEQSNDLVFYFNSSTQELLVDKPVMDSRIRWARRVSNRNGWCFWCLFGVSDIRPGKRLVRKDSVAFQDEPWLLCCDKHWKL
jgi:hypothetical protein